jgi:hypothetical protein
VDRPRPDHLRPDSSASCCSARRCATSTPGFRSKISPSPTVRPGPRPIPRSIDAYNRERLSRNEYATSALYINIQMAHRVGAVLITVAILAAAAAECG